MKAGLNRHAPTPSKGRPAMALTSSAALTAPTLPRRRPSEPTRAVNPPTSERTRGRRAAFAWREAALPGIGPIRARGWLPAVFLAVCAMALVYLVQTSGIATTGYDIQRLQAEKSDWELRNEQLRLELAKVRSLAWVESEAVGRLGMQRPASVTYLPVDTSQPSR